MSKKNQIAGLVFMLVFFLIGAITRQIYLMERTEWLKGVPQFMGALSFLSPILFSRQRWKEKKFWLDGFIWKLPFALIYILVIAVLIYLGFDAYLG